MKCVMCKDAEALPRCMLCEPCLDESVARTGGDHSPIYHVAEMHCEACGMNTKLCACPDTLLRGVRCLDCGLKVLTGGPSLMAMLRQQERAN